MAYRPGTRRNFSTYQRGIIQFCLKLGIPVDSPIVDDLSAFAEWLIQAQLAPATVRNNLSAVKTLFLLWDTPTVIDAFNSYSWALTMKEINLSVRQSLSCHVSTSRLLSWLARETEHFGHLRVSTLAPESFSESVYMAGCLAFKGGHVASDKMVKN